MGPGSLVPELWPAGDGVEPDRVLYGTDWPISSMESYLEFMDELAIPERAKRQILSENAIALFKLDPRMRSRA